MIIILLTFTLALVMEAITDALWDLKKKFTAHATQLVIFVAYYALGRITEFSPIDANFLWFVLSYVLYRSAIFDILYNLFRGLEPTYVGKTDVTDLLKRKLNKYTLGFWRFVAFFGSIWCLDWFIN